MTVPPPPPPLPPRLSPPSHVVAVSRLEEKLALPMFLATLVFVMLLSVLLRRVEQGQLVFNAWSPLLVAGLFFWTLFFLESFRFAWLLWGTAPQEGRRSSGLWWCALLPPLRLGRRSLSASHTMVLPFLGRVTVDEALRRRVTKAFHRPMLFITLLIVPVLAGETVWQAEVAGDPVLTMLLDGALVLIWAAFLVEFVILAGLAENRLWYLFTHPIDLLVILLPFAAFLRGGRLLRLTRLVRFYRGILFLQFFARWEQETKLIDQIIGMVATVLGGVLVGWFVLVYDTQQVDVMKRVPFFTVLDTASGIGKDSPVKLAGVVIGRVTGVWLRPDGSIRADLDIFQHRHALVTRGGHFQTEGFLGLASAMGQSALHFIPGPRDAPVIPAWARIRTVKDLSLEQRIQALGFEAMGAKVDAIVSQTERITQHVRAISHRVQQDQASMFASLHRVEKITADISTATGDLPRMLTRFKNSVSSLNHAIAMVNGILEKQRTVVGETAHDAHVATTRLKQSLEDLSTVLQRVAAVVSTVEKKASTLPQMMRDGSDAVENASQISHRLNRHPWFGKGGPSVDHVPGSSAVDHVPGASEHGPSLDLRGEDGR